jgi:2,3-bisphosphoglycerate-dependent phosphoglycerate mutase
MRIYLLRHGETDWNVARKIQGHTDIALNRNGIRQAKSWQPYFDRIRLAGIYSSSLTRAMDTALLASGRAPCIIDGLNERNYGEWEGQRWNDLADRSLDFDRRWKLPHSAPPGGESRLQLQVRVQHAMESIISSHEDDSEILVVAHGGSGKAVLGYANKMPIESQAAIPALRNAGVTILYREGDRWAVGEEVLFRDTLVSNL